LTRTVQERRGRSCGLCERTPSTPDPDRKSGRGRAFGLLAILNEERRRRGVSNAADEDCLGTPMPFSGLLEGTPSTPDPDPEIRTRKGVRPSGDLERG